MFDVVLFVPRCADNIKSIFPQCGDVREVGGAAVIAPRDEKQVARQVITDFGQIVRRTAGTVFRTFFRRNEKILPEHDLHIAFFAVVVIPHHVIVKHFFDAFGNIFRTAREFRLRMKHLVVADMQILRIAAGLHHLVKNRFDKGIKARIGYIVGIGIIDVFGQVEVEPGAVLLFREQPPAVTEGLEQRNHIDVVVFAPGHKVNVILLLHAPFLMQGLGGVPFYKFALGNYHIVLHRRENVADQIGVKNLGIVINQQMGGANLHVRPVFDLAFREL